MKKFQWMIVLLCSSILLASCNLPAAQEPTVESAESLMTAVAQTVEANSMATLLAGGTSMLENTVQPTMAVVIQSPTPQPTQTAQPTMTASPTPTSIPCDRAAFVSDVSVPDGTAFLPNAEFTKTWRLQNNGSCTWNSNYALVFDSGDAMNGPTSVNLSGTVAPGQTIDISVNLKAPAEVGTYKGYWKLRNASNAVFGIGQNANNPFWVEIKTQFLVMEIIPNLMFILPRYNFADKYCDAEWRSAAGVLPCPGATSDDKGFVIRKDNPTLQNGTALSGVALETHPQWVDNGTISGRFPPFTIASGDRFLAKIGCLQGGSGCNVEMQLNYRDGSGLHNLAKWNMAYGDAPKDVEVDLSGLDGQSVQMVLAVTAKGSSSQDWAIWYYPRITK
jgi:hypothetical protein